MPEVHVRDAAWLTLNEDPENWGAAQVDESRNRRRLIAAWFKLHPDHGLIELRKVAELAAKLGWELPEEFPVVAEFQSAIAGKWPWGNHTTKFLEDLAEAGKKWWSNYDPSDHTSAPTNEDVEDWLVEERGVSRTMAARMASILRANDVPPGPRR